MATQEINYNRIYMIWRLHFIEKQLLKIYIIMVIDHVTSSKRNDLPKIQTMRAENIPEDLPLNHSGHNVDLLVYRTLCNQLDAQESV